MACSWAVAGSLDVAGLGTVKLATGSENEDVLDVLPILECQCKESIRNESSLRWLEVREEAWFLGVIRPN